MQAKIQNIAEEYFPGEIEMLPEDAFESLINGKDIEILKVAGANQIELASTITLIKSVIEIIKMVFDMYATRQERLTKEQSIREMVSQKYPLVQSELGDDFNSFVNDIVNAE